jgi:hypothetical protein
VNRKDAWLFCWPTAQATSILFAPWRSNTVFLEDVGAYEHKRRAEELARYVGFAEVKNALRIYPDESTRRDDGMSISELGDHAFDCTMHDEEASQTLFHGRSCSGRLHASDAIISAASGNERCPWKKVPAAVGRKQ